MPVGAYGRRQNTSSVGGISAKPCGDDLKGIYPLQVIMFTGPNISTRSSASPSNLMAAWIQMTAKEVCLANSLSKRYRRTIQRLHPKTLTPSRSGYPHVIFHLAAITLACLEALLNI